MSSELLADLRTTTRQALSAGTGDVVDELDLAGLLVDSGRGGLGLGDREMVLVGTELGRALSPSAFLSTAVLAVALLAPGDTAAADETLAGVVAGDIRCAVALFDSESCWAATPAVDATEADGGGWLLSGTMWGISTPSRPHVILIHDGAALFAVAAGDVQIEVEDQLDPSRGLIKLELSRTPGRLLATPAVEAIATAYRRGLLAVGAEQLGVARACLDMSVEHAKSRNQFGSPIGSFQAIKHRCAEVFLDVELAQAVLDHAVQTGVAADAELAFVVATRAALSSTDACIHIHGGIGFTWEHPAHRYLRRARVNATVMGASATHRDAIAASLGIDTEL
ncbi:acyl-CoA dehydrogenase family protein [Mycobacterium vicinigordonae]|uniref:Acyl-CoA dehydrogenase n=1 Tax=Mycobacterium vicinigordonae TaxID=1719132 RepID=A0A7D6HTW0_9MYCO|nr:acyl-CoA dehydrogenase family protein [Mycobacterium vicinigordonae]QLL09831.1 acyl-CoA dehydrogenase [Mycobacterium vicinigordonae]